MAETVDARGLACPQPVILTKKALQSSSEVTVIVDNETAKKNVTMAAKKKGGAVTTTEENGTFTLHIQQNLASAEKRAPEPVTDHGGKEKISVIISGETMGRGSDELGSILIRGFFHALTEQDKRPSTVIFFNAGVKHVTEGSPVLEDIEALKQQGIEILACGTCLEYFELKNSIQIGEISNMYTIVETLMDSDKIIPL